LQSGISAYNEANRRHVPTIRSEGGVGFTDEALTTLLNDLESERVERKSSAADRDRLREAICAFSNDLPNHGMLRSSDSGC